MAWVRDVAHAAPEDAHHALLLRLAQAVELAPLLREAVDGLAAEDGNTLVRVWLRSRAAAEAVRAVAFRPATLRGEPVASSLVLRVEFTLAD